jgi:8-oxo-dGTP pyrophosphatase MutT (NUDIX family)
MTTTRTCDLLSRALDAIEGAHRVSSDYDLNPDVVLPVGRRLRPAGVLVLLAEKEGDWHVYLTKRSSALKHHPGQVSFPGGKQEGGDADITATALREANEEIGLPVERVRIVGHLPVHETVTSFNVTPVVGLLEREFPIARQETEVAEVFTVPLSHVLDPANFSVQSRRWQGRWRSYYAVPYGPYYVWGATARMLRGWADAMEP